MCEGVEVQAKGEAVMAGKIRTQVKEGFFRVRVWTRFCGWWEAAQYFKQANDLVVFASDTVGQCSLTQDLGLQGSPCVNPPKKFVGQSMRD